MPTFIRWIKLVVFNIILLTTLLVFLEFAYRVYDTVEACIFDVCNFAHLRKLTVRNLALAPENLGLTRFDTELGYVPKEGFDAIISNEDDRWINAKVTISDEGFRLNDNHDLGPLRAKVLAVGDSFTFGDQVSNHETWPSCLERKLLNGVDNGGVFGYGSAQALKRASMKLMKKQYSTVILSVLVGQDFQRDQLSYRSGFPRPAVIDFGKGLQFDSVPDPKRPGTRYNPKANDVIVYLWTHSLIFSSIIDQDVILNSKIDVTHPQAADKQEIINWTLKLLAELPVDNKILLLQYSKRNFAEKGTKVMQERQYILDVAKDLQIQTIDMFDELHKYDRERLWGSPHHTPFGNTVVCEYLYDRAFE